MKNLYGKGYKMQVALALKATRIAWAKRFLKPRKFNPIGFEKWWYDRLKESGTLKPDIHWIDMVQENKGFLIADRMAQVLNTMDVQEWSLKEICLEYKELFGSIDPVALGIPATQKDELLDFLEVVQ
ncbi:MAG: hypothetical protein K2N48_10530 [Muribaculaceae bacterium]|nr:hypothetical protein [Muribaculaceae bacterium]